MHHEVSIEIAASPELIWSTLSDVERWPEWTASVSAVERLDSGDFGVGSRARVKQPGMPGLVWEVTEYTPGEVFSWASKVPGVTTTGGHRLAAPKDGRVPVTLSLDQEGFLAPVVSRLTGSRSRRYVQIEADGLKRRSESAAHSTVKRSHGLIAAAVVVAAAASGIAVAVVAGGGSNDEADADRPRIVQPGAPGEEGRELSEDDAAIIDPLAHTPADTRFMQGMIAHHQQR